MKRFISLVLAAGIAVSSVSAAHVDKNVAARYGGDFIKSISGRDVTVKNVEMNSDNWYVVNYYPQGWAIIAADDASRPVIGYSTTGSLQWHSLPDNMKTMLDSYSKQIETLRGKNLIPDVAWSQKAVESRAIGAKVDPLITVNWNQDSPFNKYCPSGALVGCVAVSMSQAMSVQRYPARPKGNVSYSCSGYGQLSVDFDAQKAYNWDNIMSGAVRYDEAARLMWHAGMSVFMGYGADGSGIPSNQIYRISDALVNNFSYPSTVSYHYRDRYSDDKWTQMVLNELLAGRAVIYNAIASKANAGHSFNVDGYDGLGQFHINWGWGGYGNGYFSLNYMSDAFQSLDFDTGHRIVIGVGSPQSEFRTLELSDTRIEQGVKAGSVVAVVTVNGETPKADYKMRVIGRDGYEAVNDPAVPFELDGAMLRITRDVTDKDLFFELMVSVTDDSGSMMTQGFFLSVEKPRTLEAATRMTFDRATGTFTINTKHNTSYVLTAADGRIVGQGDLSPVPVLTFKRSDLSAGANTLKLTNGSDVKTVVIKN